MQLIRIALDWTPNINHIGIFVAKDLGFFEEAAINLEILNPLTDNYALTPGKKLESNLADFALAPFETVISLNNKKNQVAAVAVFALLQEDLSCIVTLKDSGINHPKQLDQKSYASYKARYEDHIVKQLVINAGGTGDLELRYPEKLGIWNTLLDGKADATWIFDNWEGVEAAKKGVELHKFRLKDYHIPYGYSPVVLTTQAYLSINNEVCVRFISALKKAYLYVQENPIESIKILRSYLSDTDIACIDLDRSLALTSPYFGTADNFGYMDEEKVRSFLKWLVDNRLEKEIILKQQLFTNDFIKT
jgi:ABC-type nitrate/sulfonate/bicarbonate transport system substrate-binding protein